MTDTLLDGALCAQVGPEPFFRAKGESCRDAKRLCARCEVRDACLDLALREHIHDGIWGGLSPKQRRGMEAVV